MDAALGEALGLNGVGVETGAPGVVGGMMTCLVPRRFTLDRSASVLATRMAPGVFRNSRVVSLRVAKLMPPWMVKAGLFVGARKSVQCTK
jgi:hypothetical protein